VVSYLFITYIYIYIYVLIHFSFHELYFLFFFFRSVSTVPVVRLVYTTAPAAITYNNNNNNDNTTIVKTMCTNILFIIIIFYLSLLTHWHINIIYIYIYIQIRATDLYLTDVVGISFNIHNCVPTPLAGARGHTVVYTYAPTSPPWLWKRIYGRTPKEDCAPAAARAAHALENLWKRICRVFTLAPPPRTCTRACSGLYFRESVINKSRDCARERSPELCARARVRPCTRGACAFGQQRGSRCAREYFM
jgi:hypothetical protein